MKCGTSVKVASSGPMVAVEDSSHSSIMNASSISISSPQEPTTLRNVCLQPGGAISRGRAGSSVPGWPATGTGCWRGVSSNA